ncbi:MAG: hypothetical protein LBD11_08000 [Candidatus Peribacteria bacterium]|nr:hypothetical protein [Candidatus Peribacteria bacterium]
MIENAIEEVSEEETPSDVPASVEATREMKQSQKEGSQEEIPGVVSQVIAQDTLEPQPLDPKIQKLLDRIYVEANFLKNEGKFEDYEKKVIEGLAIDPTNLELTKMLTDLYFTL